MTDRDVRGGCSSSPRDANETDKTRRGRVTLTHRPCGKAPTGPCQQQQQQQLYATALVLPLLPTVRKDKKETAQAERCFWTRRLLFFSFCSLSTLRRTVPDTPRRVRHTRSRQRRQRRIPRSSRPPHRCFSPGALRVPSLVPCNACDGPRSANGRVGGARCLGRCGVSRK